MLRLETLVNGLALRREALEWIRRLAELSPEAVDVLKLAQHLDDWRQWAEDLEQEIASR
jgi:1,4-dihydroxy-2-naphthoyl-CoA synthase